MRMVEAERDNSDKTHERGAGDPERPHFLFEPLKPVSLVV